MKKCFPFPRYISNINVCNCKRKWFRFNFYQKLPSHFTRISVSCLYFVLVICIKYCHSTFVVVERRKRGRASIPGPSHSFFHSLSSCRVLYVSRNSITLSFFVLKYWNTLFLLFLFCRPLRFSETICKFSILEGILTHLVALCLSKTLMSKTLKV